MKINTTFHILVFLMAVLTFSTPFVTMAQQNFVQAEVATAAEADANKDVSKLLCFSAGCVLSALFFLPSPYGYLLPPAGIIGSYSYRPGPPPSRLIGKSPEYIYPLIQQLTNQKEEISKRYGPQRVVSVVALSLRLDSERRLRHSELENWRGGKCLLTCYF